MLRKKTFSGPGSCIPPAKFHAFHTLAFVERRPLRECCRMIKLSRVIARAIHRDIRSYMAIGEIHPGLRRPV